MLWFLGHPIVYCFASKLTGQRITVPRQRDGILVIRNEYTQVVDKDAVSSSDFICRKGKGSLIRTYCDDRSIIPTIHRINSNQQVSLDAPSQARFQCPLQICVKSDRTVREGAYRRHATVEDFQMTCLCFSCIKGSFSGLAVLNPYSQGPIHRFGIDFKTSGCRQDILGVNPNPQSLTIINSIAWKILEFTG
ncbi:hypothetical protein ES703_120313 [subsurface metagenome]